jgi:hypothetical protein
MEKNHILSYFKSPKVTWKTLEFLSFPALLPFKSKNLPHIEQVSFYYLWQNNLNILKNN